VPKPPDPRRRRAPALGIGILAFVATGYVFWIGQEIIKPLVIALMLVTMMQPFVALMNRFKIPTWAAVTLLIGLLLRMLVWGGETVVAQAWSFLTSEPFLSDSEPGGLRERIEGFVADEEQDTADAATGGDAAPGPGDETAPDDEGDSSGGAPADEGGAAGPSGGEARERSAPEGGDGLADPGLVETTVVPADEATPPVQGPTLRGFSDMIAELEHVLERVGIPTQLVQNIGAAIESWYRQEDTLTTLGVGFTSVSIGFIAKFILVVAFIAFLFAEGRVFRQKVLAIAGHDADEAARVLSDIVKRVQRYLLVKTAASLLTGVICYWSLVALGVPYALTFGFFTFLLNYIPTFGSFIAAVPPFLFSFVGAQSLAIPLFVVLVYLTTNIVIGTLLEPRVLGDELNLSPIVILMSVAFWATLWGPTGAFLAVPMTAAAQISMAHIDSLRPIAILLSNRVPEDGTG